MDFPKSVPGVGLVNGRFIDEDPLAATPGSLIPSAWGNSVTLELTKVIEDAGLNPDEDDNTQLSVAIKALASAEVKFASQSQVNEGSSSNLSVAPKQLAAALQVQAHTAFTAGGAAPAFTLAPVPAVTAYTTKQRFQVTFNSAGGANPTLNVSGVGPKSLKQFSPSGAKVAANITVGLTSDISYDGVDFVLLDPLAVDAMPVVGGPYYPSFNGMRIAAEAGGYGTIGGYQGWGSNGSGTYQFINSKGGGSTGGFLFTHSDASGNLTNAMRYTPDGRLAVAVELYVPAIVSNTSAPTQGAGYSGTYLANCAFVANAIAAIPKNTATFTANSYSKNADTGEILQYKEVLIGDIPAGGATIDVTWPFAFPNAFHNVVSVTLKSADATVRHITTAYTSMGTVNGCRLQVDEANQSVQPASLTAVITARGR